MQDMDLLHVKNFINFGAGLLELGASSATSRFAVTVFTALYHHPVNFENCCDGGNLPAWNTIDSIDLEFLDRDQNKSEILHPDLDPLAVDIRYGFRSIRGTMQCLVTFKPNSSRKC